MKVEIDREEDGRWIAEIPDLPGVMAYGRTRDEAMVNVKALAARALADRAASTGAECDREVATLGASKSFGSFLEARSGEAGDIPISDVRKKPRKLFFRSRPQLYVIPGACAPHQRVIGDWTARESFEPVDDRTLPDGVISYSIWIETPVSCVEEIWEKRSAGYKLADVLNRVWTYACGRPINAAYLALVACDAPPAWSTNAAELEHTLRVEHAQLTAKISVEPRHWMSGPCLPLARALDMREAHLSASPLVTTLIKLHYLALTDEGKEPRLFLLAKALELVRALLPGQTNQQTEDSLPREIRDGLRESVHWLFEMANTRADVRHVVRKGQGACLHPRMSEQERRSFEHDADLVIRTVVCTELGQEPFLLESGPRPRHCP